ncbi:DNA-binding protein [Stutzerimonas nitrititolerans]|uniref:DNA-binding protein n=1 Tax=Stutzerimonas nitrititolerans TaxID=2482751 RepID=UPI00289F69BB|nr:DNA-binding protein [Stutzerimonas nitrititolerans]
MTDGVSDRALLLLEATSLKELAEVNSKEYVRWQNIKRGKARISAEEIEALANLYKNYRWWLITGEVMPDKGQTSPEYDQANRNLQTQSAG